MVDLIEVTAEELWQNKPECVTWCSYVDSYILDDRKLLYRGTQEFRELYIWLVNIAEVMEYESETLEYVETMYHAFSDYPDSYYEQIVFADTARGLIEELWWCYKNKYDDH